VDDDDGVFVSAFSDVGPGADTERSAMTRERRGNTGERLN